MFKHLLVPLDGSLMAESVLPATVQIAVRLKASVTLVHIIEENPPAEIHRESHLQDPEQARRYLGMVAGRAFPAGIDVDYHVHTAKVENVAGSICEHVTEIGADLIVMCTHGKSGPREMLFGSIAQKIIASGATPVLLIQPTPGAQPTFSCNRLLVPLDGNPEHEHGLPAARAMAEAFAAALRLLMVVPTFGKLAGQIATASRLLPGTTTKMLDLSIQTGEEYLKQIQTELGTTIRDVSYQVLRGDPAKIIVDTALATDTDLIVLGTHGTPKMEAFWLGSVTPKVAARCKVPLLLVPRQK